MSTSGNCVSELQRGMYRQEDATCSEFKGDLLGADSSCSCNTVRELSLWKNNFKKIDKTPEFNQVC